MSQEDRSNIIFQNSLEQILQELMKSIHDTQHSFQRINAMYTTIFIFGIILLSIAIYLAIFDENQELYVSIFGGVGGGGMLAFFLYKPAQEIQRSRRNLSHLVTAVATWLEDIRSWSNALLAIDYENEQNLSITQYVELIKLINKGRIQDTIALLQLIYNIQELDRLKDEGSDKVEKQKRLKALVEDVKSLYEDSKDVEQSFTNNKDIENALKDMKDIVNEPLGKENKEI